MKAVNHDKHQCRDRPRRDALGNRLPRPPYHPTIAKAIKKHSAVPVLQPESLSAYREAHRPLESTMEIKLDKLPIVKFCRRVYYSNQKEFLSYTIFMPKDPSISGTLRPCIFYIQPGGPVAGYELFGIDQVLAWVVELNLICVSVNYFLAPEKKHPKAVYYCFLVLNDIKKHNEFSDQQISSGIDLEKICIMAGQGGAAIAASLVLFLRNETRKAGLRKRKTGDDEIPNDTHVPSAGPSKKRKLSDGTKIVNSTPTKTQGATEKGTSWELQSMKANHRGFIRFKGMMLYSPMLDYHLDGVSAAQFAKGNYYDAEWSDQCWSLYFRGTFASLRHDVVDREKYKEFNLGRMDDLNELPATFIEVGSCEALRSEAVRFAEQMWRCGGDCELHVWAGGCTGFPRKYPELQISKSAIEARRKWIERTLCGLE